MDPMIVLAFISMGLSLFAPILIAIIGSCFQKDNYPVSGGGASIDVHLPDGEEYKDKIGTPEKDRPSIAEQFDGRITNVFRNPWEGIL